MTQERLLNTAVAEHIMWKIVFIFYQLHPEITKFIIIFSFFFYILGGPRVLAVSCNGVYYFFFFWKHIFYPKNPSDLYTSYYVSGSKFCRVGFLERSFCDYFINAVEKKKITKKRQKHNFVEPEFYFFHLCWFLDYCGNNK